MKFSHKLTHHLNRLHIKNHKKISLYAKVIHKIPLFLNSKMTLKAFGFKPDSINKSCRFIFLDSKKTGLVIFGFYYTFLWILQVDS
jgi:hypothetical protein